MSDEMTRLIEGLAHGKFKTAGSGSLNVYELLAHGEGLQVGSFEILQFDGFDPARDRRLQGGFSIHALRRFFYNLSEIKGQKSAVDFVLVDRFEPEKRALIHLKPGEMLAIPKEIAYGWYPKCGATLLVATEFTTGGWIRTEEYPGIDLLMRNLPMINDTRAVHPKSGGEKICPPLWECCRTCGHLDWAEKFYGTNGRCPNPACPGLGLE